MSRRSRFHDLDRWFDDFFGRSWLPALWEDSTEWPRVDVRDEDGQVLVRAEVPGVGKDDLDVTVTEDSVSIRGETKHEHQEGDDDSGYYRRELRYGRFARTIPVPTPVQSDQASAKYRDGVLEIRIPKAEEEGSGTRVNIE
ncbi:MAG: Hsp20/alpha crystallin family protein [Armatimonadota bacterium]